MPDHFDPMAIAEVKLRGELLKAAKAADRERGEGTEYLLTTQRYADQDLHERGWERTSSNTARKPDGTIIRMVGHLAVISLPRGTVVHRSAGFDRGWTAKDKDLVEFAILSGRLIEADA